MYALWSLHEPNTTSFPHFVYPPQNVSIGAWEVLEPYMGANLSNLPTSPTGVVGVVTGVGVAGQQESPELTVEYWSPKGQSQKVRDLF